MKKQMIRVGAEVLDKITGQVMVVTGVTDGIGTVYPKEADPGNENPKLITPDNCICFRFLRNDTKTPVEEAVLKDGILSVNGVPLETGSLKLSEILGTLPGKVILTACSGAAKDALYIYDVDRDRFTSVGRGLAEGGTQVLEHAGTIFVLNTDTVKETQEDGTPKDIATADILYAIGANGYASVDCEACSLTGAAAYGPDVYVIAEGHVIDEGAPFTQVFHFDTEMDDLELAMDPEITGALVTAGPLGLAVFAADGIAVKYGEREYLLTAPGIAGKVNPDGTEMAVVDATAKGDTLTVTFADPETYATVAVQSVRTRDRGDIVTVL